MKKLLFTLLMVFGLASSLVAKEQVADPNKIYIHINKIIVIENDNIVEHISVQVKSEKNESMEYNVSYKINSDDIFDWYLDSLKDVINASF